MLAHQPLTKEFIDTMFNFDVSTGIITYKHDGNNQYAKRGREAGWIENTGYRRIKIGKHRYMAHLLVWCHVTGTYPADCEIDHINLNKLDNRFCNLRSVTKSQNCMNRRRRVDNRTNYKGVTFDKSSGKYLARISVNGDRKRIGYYDTPEAAWFAYVAESEKLHGEYGRVV